MPRNLRRGACDTTSTLFIKRLSAGTSFLNILTAKHADVPYETNNTLSGTFISRGSFGPVPVSVIERTLFSVAAPIKIFVGCAKSENADPALETRARNNFGFDRFPIRHRRFRDLHLTRIKRHFNVIAWISPDGESGQRTLINRSA